MHKTIGSINNRNLNSPHNILIQNAGDFSQRYPKTFLRTVILIQAQH